MPFLAGSVPVGELVHLFRSAAIPSYYTWSHAIDGGSSWHSGETTANGFAGGDGFSTDFTQPGLDRGNSIFDIRHRVSLHYVWELPFFRLRHDWVGTMLYGWQLNGIWSFQTGAHWTPFRGGLLAHSTLHELMPGACSA
jgi:hypothetical protein